MKYRRERHSVTDLKVHLVCVTKYREDVFSEQELELVEKVFYDVAEKMNFQILEINGEKEQHAAKRPSIARRRFALQDSPGHRSGQDRTAFVHALIEYPPKLSVSKIVNALKGVSSRRYGQAGFRKPKNGKALWSPSYFAVSVGQRLEPHVAPIEVLIRYIKEQSRPQRTGLESQ